MNREIHKLQEIIENRNAELENLAKEKNQIRQSLEAEIVRAKAELEEYCEKKEYEISDLNMKLVRLNK